MGKNHISIPYLPKLSESKSWDEITNTLEEFGSRKSLESVNWQKDFPYKPLTTFTVAHSGEALFIDFFVRCNYLKAENYQNQSPVSRDSCVEFFIQPNLDSPEYYNFEFNCIGAVNASHRIERSNPTRLTDDEILRIKRYASCGTRPFRELEGLFTWNILVIIPFDLIGIDYANSDKPLKVKGNFYKCASETSLPHYLSWAPIKTPKPDFHRPEFFGDITLE